MDSTSEEMVLISGRDSAAAVRTLNPASAIKAFLILAGGFTFSFLLGEAVHESGHYLAHIFLGNQDASVYLDPFGGSRIIGVTGFQTRVMGAVTSAAGPLFNLLLAGAFFILLWRRRNGWLLPILMWGPAAMVQEGVNFSIGLLTPGGDAQWITSTGLPVPLLAVVGVFLLLAGASTMTLLLPMASIHRSNPSLENFCLITAGFCTLMGIRFIHSLFAPGQHLMENLVPLVFTVLLASLVVLLYYKAKNLIKNTTNRSTQPISWSVSLATLSAGIGIFVLQLFVGRF